MILLIEFIRKVEKHLLEILAAVTDTQLFIHT